MENLKREKTNDLVKDNLLLVSNIAQDLNPKQVQLMSYALVTMQENQEGVYISNFKLADFLKRFKISKDNYKKKDIISDLDFLATINLKKLDEFVFTEYINKGRYTRMNFIAIAKYDSGVINIEWIQNKAIKTILKGASKEVSKYSLDTLSKLGKKGWELYEIITLFNQNGETQKVFELNELASLFKVRGKKAGDFNYINTQYLKPSIEQINKETDIYMMETRIKTGRKITGVELKWQNQKQSSLMTDKQRKMASDLLVQFQRYNVYYFDDKEYQSLLKTLKNCEDFSTKTAYTLLNDAKAKMEQVRREIKNYEQVDYELQEIEPYDGFFQIWDGEIRPKDRARFIKLAEKFSEDERREILLNAFNIAKERGGERFAYVITVLQSWIDRNVKTAVEAERIYEENFGGYEYRQRKQLEENAIDVSPDFLEAMDLWKD